MAESKLRMLQQFFILTREGSILWRYKSAHKLGDPLLVTFRNSCLGKEQPTGPATFDYNARGAAYTLKWIFHNDTGLVFLAVFHQKIFRDLLYVDALFSLVQPGFLEIYDPEKSELYKDFDETFRKIKDDFESKQVQLGRYKKNKGGWFSSMFHRMTLELSDMEPALEALKSKLMTKNVAENVAEELCDTVADKLEGTKLGWCKTISSTVQAAMEEVLVGILTPGKGFNRIRIVNPQTNVLAASEEKKPFVSVYIKTNRDWKATDWVGAAHRLEDHRKTSLIIVADFDTLRSKDVEKLRSDPHRLENPPIFEDYEKDPTVVMKEAIQEARDKGSDVIVHADGSKQAAGVLLMTYLYGAEVNFIGFEKPYTRKKHPAKSVVKKLLK